jgi:hypothetical protein
LASLTQEQIEAAHEFAASTVDTLGTERGVHAETAVAAAARMAGTFLFRSFDFPMGSVQPGQVVLSEQANEQGPALIQILGGVLSHIGIDLNEDALGTPPGPDHQPNLEFLETQRRLEPVYRAIAVRHGLGQRAAAAAGAVAAALLIDRCAQVLDPGVDFGIAVYGFIEGSKTAPDPVVL